MTIHKYVYLVLISFLVYSCASETKKPQFSQSPVIDTSHTTHTTAESSKSESPKKFVLLYTTCNISFTEQVVHVPPRQDGNVTVGDEVLPVTGDAPIPQYLNRDISLDETFWNILPYKSEDQVYLDLDAMKPEIDAKVKRKYLLKQNVVWKTRERNFLLFPSYADASKFANLRF